jgi:hypothetical protein
MQLVAAKPFGHARGATMDRKSESAARAIVGGVDTHIMQRQREINASRIAA